MSYWNNREERLDELTRLRSEGMVWKDIKAKTKFSGTVSSLRSTYCAYMSDMQELDEQPLELLKGKYRSQKSARYSRKESKILLEELTKREDLLAEISKKLTNIQVDVSYVKPKKKRKGTPMICEALISDIQIGKVTPDYNTQICFKRMEKHGKALLFKILQHQDNGYKFEKIILSFMGDIIESAEKAQKKGTALSVDSYTSEQIVNATDGIFRYIIAPIATLGIPVEVIGVPGNHDHRNNGIPMDKAGIICDTWIIYKTLELLSKQFKNVSFKITSGCYETTDIFNHTAVYEHGYGISVAEANLLNRLNQRSRQSKKHITYFRMGDKHSITRFNEDQLVVNGAYFGISQNDKGHDYSSAMGFAAHAGQIAFFHVPREDERLPCYDSFIIQLNHIKE